MSGTEPTIRGLVELFRRGAIVLDENGIRAFLPFFRKFLADFNDGSPAEQALSCRLAGMADGRTWVILGMGVDPVFPRNVIRVVPPLPADTIRASEIGQYDPYYVAAVLLAVIALLLTFVGPVIILRLPAADQATINDYYSGIPGLAVALTGFILTHRLKGK